MTISEQTHQKLERVIRKISQKFPNISDTGIVTDIHLRVVQDSGELLVFDDEENEITRCVVEQWIDNKDDCFYADVVQVLRKEFQRMSDTVDKFGILKPFSVVLENEEHENMGEIYVADDDTLIIGGDIMEGLDKDLDKFLEDLLK
ncbi:MAG: hypothetical protein II562_00575 [Prevotella sp.]|nr:hypothetical protein [Prevotella sp.]